tara:strand:- start:1142 stop:1597 length:456 start_codon:yes stop_codon:yes gene_type:complete
MWRGWKLTTVLFICTQLPTRRTDNGKDEIGWKQEVPLQWPKEDFHWKWKVQQVRKQGRRTRRVNAIWKISEAQQRSRSVMDHTDIFVTVRVFPYSKEAKEVVKDHGPVMRLLETSKNGPFEDWDDQVLLNPLQGIQTYWFRNGIDMEYELT